MEHGGWAGRGSQGGLHGGGCTLKEGRIRIRMVLYKHSRQLGDQARGEAGTQAGEDWRTWTDRVWGGYRVASGMGQRNTPPHTVRMPGEGDV